MRSRTFIVFLIVVLSFVTIAPSKQLAESMTENNESAIKVEGELENKLTEKVENENEPDEAKEVVEETKEVEEKDEVTSETNKDSPKKRSQLSEEEEEEVEEEQTKEETEEVEKEIKNEIISLKAITDSVMMGQKLVAVIVEYEEEVDHTTIGVNTFKIKDLYYDNTMQEATITNVYTNDTPTINNDKTSIQGNYIIVEIDPLDRVGYMVGDYIDPATNEVEPYWVRPDVSTQLMQVKDINGLNGEVISAGDEEEWLEMTEETTHLKVEEFEPLTLESENSNGLDILSYYYLPDGYEQSSKEYPIVFVAPGGGLRYWEKQNSQGETINNAGANILFDQAATAWMNNGFEDVIIVSVHNRGKYAPEEYDASADINQVAEYFIQNYKVDADRVYYSGNSAGSLIGYETIGKRPDIWAAFMANNGLSHFGDITTEEGKEAFQQEIEEVMEPFVSSEIAMLWQLGFEDEGASGPKGQLFYDFMYKEYEDKGFTEEEIDAILQLNLYYEDDFVQNNVVDNDGSYNPHLATKLALTVDRENFIPWMLSQKKHEVTEGEESDGEQDIESLDDYPVPEIDITAANLLPINGYFQQTVTVDGENRNMHVYIPEGTPIRAFFTVIAVPDGIKTKEFIEQSGWLSIANNKQEGLIILEPEEDGWGSFEDELKYVEAVIDKASDPTYYSTMGEYYFVGYGKGGTALQGWAVDHPLFVISQAYIETDDMHNEYLNSTGNKVYGTEIDRKGYDDVPYKEVPVPTWMIQHDLNEVKNATNYWKEANDTVKKAKKDSALLDSDVFSQAKNSNAWSTQYSGPISKVATLEKEVELHDESLSESIYDFLSYYTRYDNTSVYGNGLGVRGNYDVHTIDIEEPDGRTWVREYVTYVPSSYDESKKYPVLYALPGNTQTGRVFFEATQWWQVAEENDFIVVFPSSQYSSATSVTWNTENISTEDRANDFTFIEAVINEVDGQYNTDKTKRFATGQSLGSVMTQHLSLYLPEYFSALGSTSLTMFDIPDEKYNDILPFYLIIGEKDIDAYDFKNVDNKTNQAVNYWTSRNNLSGYEDWSDYTKDGRYHTYTWNNDKDIPLFKYGWTEARSHNNIHAEAALLWNTWFTHWTMEDGIRYFNGKPIHAETSVDKSKLQSLVSEIEGKKLNKKDYTKKSWNTLQQNIKKAKKILSDNEVQQDEVNTMLEQLQKAYDGLEKKKSSNKKVDISELEKIVKELEKKKLKEKDFTPDSWKEFQAALKNAKKVFSQTEKTQYEVDKALKELQIAYNALEKKNGKDRQKNKEENISEEDQSVIAVKNDGDNKGKQGSKLPNTATQTFMYIFLGLVIVTIGIFLMLWKRKKFN